MTDEQLNRFIQAWNQDVSPDMLKRFIGEECYFADFIDTLATDIHKGITHKLVGIDNLGSFVYIMEGVVIYKYCIPKSIVEAREASLDILLAEHKNLPFTKRYGVGVCSMEPRFKEDSKLNQEFLVPDWLKEIPIGSDYLAAVRPSKPVINRLEEAGEILCNGEPIEYHEDLDIIPTKGEYDPVLDIIKYTEEAFDKVWLGICDSVRNLQKAKEENMNAVTVNFMNGCTNRFEGKGYTYLVEGTYKEGDYLIFKNYNQNGNCTVVKVVAFTTDLDTLDKSINYKELTVLGTADMTPYLNEVKRQEKEKRKAQIMEELEANFEEANKMNLYRELAKQDKGMAELLKELDSLDK